MNSKIIPLTSILQDNQTAINAFASDLQKRGFAFVKLGPNLVNQIDLCMLIMEQFFSQQVEYKKKFVKEPIFGYFGVEHKESFRILTGSRLSEHKFPDNFDRVQNLIKIIDRIMHSLVLLCSPVLFPNVITEAKNLDIPLLNTDKSWGMFDIAKYHNDGTRTKMNCEEHFDPGLLSLSLRSTEPGLQLKDEFGRWIIPPNDKTIAIIWAGKAATLINPKIKSGVHRVVNPIKPGIPRISMWHEICTAAQEHTELIYDKKIDPIKTESKTGIPMTKSIQPVKFKSKIDISTKKSISVDIIDPFNFESKTGIPISKSMPPERLVSKPITNPRLATDIFMLKPENIEIKKLKPLTQPKFSTILNSSPMFRSYNPKNMH